MGRWRMLQTILFICALVGPVSITPAQAADQPVGTIYEVPWGTPRNFAFDYSPNVHDVSGDILLGHPLDVAWAGAGHAWSLGEFAMAASQFNSTSMTRRNIPIRGGVWDAVRPYRHTGSNARENHSDAGEKVLRIGGDIWVAQGGGMVPDGMAGNHSRLTRFDASSPGTVCSVPVPGDNNQVIGMTYDPVRDRLWFTQSNGEGTEATTTTLSWLDPHETGYCRNQLDYDDVEGATAVGNSLRCSSETASNCVHTEQTYSRYFYGSFGHLAHDNGLLWIVDVSGRYLLRYDIAAKTMTALPFIAPDPTRNSSPLNAAYPWQIATTATAVYVNEYEGNRLTRYDKDSGTWSAINLPGPNLCAHSLKRVGARLWFTQCQERNSTSAGSTIGYVNLNAWSAGSPTGRRYGGWGAMSHAAGQIPNFRGIDVTSAGRIVTTNDGYRDVLILTPK